MLSAGSWIPNQNNLVTFVLSDNAGTEVTGLGSAFTVQLAKSGGVMLPGIGTKGESGAGWYWYLGTALDADTIGPISIAITAVGCTQQNLEYVCGVRTTTSIEYSYSLTDDILFNPLPGVEVWFTKDSAGNETVWYGVTDSFGVALDGNGNKPRLEPGNYYAWRVLAGYIATDPQLVTVS